MSVSGILSSNFSNYTTQNVQNQMQQFRQEFQQLGQDLQSGNLSAAQQDYATIQQDFQSHAAAHGHHHHHGGGSGQQSEISQLLSELGQALQSGNLSSAQQAYSTLMQDFQQFGQSSGSSATLAAQSGSSNFSVSV